MRSCVVKHLSGFYFSYCFIMCYSLYRSQFYSLTGVSWSAYLCEDTQDLSQGSGEVSRSLQRLVSDKLLVNSTENKVFVMDLSYWG